MSPTLRFSDFTDEWATAPMEEIYPQIRNGFVGTATPFYCQGGIRYVQGRNIKAGNIQENGFETITEAFHRKCIKSQLKSNDILMVQSGHVGECAVVTEPYADSNCHALLVLTPKYGEVDSRFYVSYFYSSSGRGQIHTIKTGNTIAHILSSDLKEVVVPRPTLPEQRKIAGFLTAVDGRIGQLSQKKALLVDYKRGVMQQLFTHALRFKDENGNDFPDWEEKTLGAIASFSKGRGISKADVHEDGTLPCIRYGELYTHYAELIRDVKSRTNVPEKELVLSQRNDVIIPASGETHIDISTASCVTLDGVALGGDLNIIRTKQDGTGRLA